MKASANYPKCMLQTLWGSNHIQPPPHEPTQSLLSVAFEGGDDDGADLSHTHAQKALVQALDQPALAHQGVLRLLASVAEVGLIQAQSKTHFTLCWTPGNTV